VQVPLILAVEPDPDQAAELTALVRRQFDAELVLGAGTEAALRALAGRVPDLVLTSPLIPPRDESELVAWLRELGIKGSHVQTVTIPVLASAAPPSVSRGSTLPFGRGRSTAATPDSCDPAVFADWVSVYLELAQTHRGGRPGVAARP
jgi:CheY-like chemotaxis protein